MKPRVVWPWPLVLPMMLLAVIAPGGLSKSEDEPAEPPGLSWPKDSPVLPSEPVGYIEASSSVGPNGEYRISVPLDVPLGVAGMAPALALTYGSNGGNDIVGVGWSLSGTSILQRCGATVATDGFMDGVDFAGDRFCLDGSKLVAVAGAYGADGTEYRTESEPFSKIVSSGDSGLGPEKLTVYRPGGRISTYLPVNTVQTPFHFAYLLSDTADRNGNSIHYDYAVDNALEELGGLSVLLADISYTHHGLLADGSRQVVLHYEDRPDTSFAYVAGVRTRRDKRLSGIEMRAPNPGNPETVWSYALTYDTSPDTGRSRLRSIRKLDAAGQHLWDKQLDWAEHERPSFDTRVLASELEKPVAPWRWELARVLPVDVDGDGKDELLYQLAGSLGDEARLRKTLDAAMPLNGERYAFAQDVVRISEGRPIDRENDGRFEILARELDDQGSWVHRAYRWDAAPGSFVEAPGLGGAVLNVPGVADFDGSGWADTLLIPDHRSGESANWQLELGGVNGFSAAVDSGVEAVFPEPQRAGDIDGDGRGDVIIADPDFVPESTPPGFVPPHTAALRVDDDGSIVKDARWDLGEARGVVLADLNGDGLKDAVDLSGHAIGTPVRYNRGDGFGAAVLLPTDIARAPDDQPGVRVADFDRDGADDLLVFRDNGYLPAMAVYLARPGGFEELVIDHAPHPPGPKSWETVKAGDFDGDGLVDVVDLEQDEIEGDAFNAHLEVLVQTAGESDVVTGIRDEQASSPRETVSYRRAVDRVDGDDVCAFPQRCLRRGMLLVDEVETYRQDSAIPERRMRYRFAGGRADVLGRGFLGFARVIADDLDSHARTITTYDNTTRDGTIYPFAGLPATTESIVPILFERNSEGGLLTTAGNNAVARVHRAVTSYATSWQYGHRAFFVRPARSVETEWEQPCSIAGLAVELLGDAPPPAREVTRTFDFDDYGNPTHETHRTAGGVHGEVTRVFENRTDGDWRLGLERKRYVVEAELGSSPAPRVTFQDYDDRGQLQRVTREPFEPALKQTTAYAYDDRGLVAKVTRAAPGLAPRHTYLFYDNEGVFLRATENDLGHVVQTITHPAFGVPVLTQDENGVQTRFSYDGFGRLRRVDPDGGIATDIHYAAWGEDGDLRGMAVSASSADGSAGHRHTDERGRLREEATTGFDGAWMVSAVDYTAYGHPFLRSRPGVGAPGAVTATQFDTLGRVQSVLPPDGAVTSFAYEMFRTTSIDPKGRVRRTDLDVDGRPVESHEYGEDGHDIATRYRYGDFGRLARIVDAAGHETAFSYDKLGRRLSVADPDRGEVHFDYSGFDEPTRQWDDLHDIAFRYDVLGRLTSKEDTHGTPAITEVTAFAYDDGPGAIGRLTRATSPDDVVTSFAYNALGQPITIKWAVGGEVFAVEQTYGMGGRPDELRYPEVPGRDRFFVKLGYNLHGYVDTLARNAGFPIDPFWKVEARTPDGALGQARWDNGPIESRFYDSLTGRLQNVRIDKEKAGADAPLFDVAYTYEAGELATRTDAVTGRVESFAYDALDRLKKWTLGGPANRTAEYGYDDLGNLTSVAATWNGQSQPVETLGYDPLDRPHAARTRSVGAQPAAEYHYDARGRQFEGGGRGITWTSFDLPRTVTQAGQTTTSLYDAFGARVEKTRTAPSKPAETTITIGGLYERRTAGNTVDHRFYVLGDGEPVTEVVYHEAGPAEETHHLARDGHGSIAVVLAPDGAVLERLFYEPFGGRTDVAGAPVNGSSSGVPWGFTGHREDDDLALVDMRGRIYDPLLRRFLSPDPIVQNVLAAQSLNHYSYVWNNPLRYVDPSGLDGESAAPEPKIYTISDEGGYSQYFFFTPTPAPELPSDPGKQLLPGADAGRAPADPPQVDDASHTAPTPPDSKRLQAALDPGGIGQFTEGTKEGALDMAVGAAVFAARTAARRRRRSSDWAPTSTRTLRRS